MTGCSKPFNVKTKTDLGPANYAASSTTDNISIQAQAIKDEDLLYETFDANLISAGVLPVRVMLTNSSAEPVDLQKARFEIRQPDGHGFKAVDERTAFKRLISYYEIKAYNKGGYKESLGTFSEYGVDLTGLIPQRRLDGDIGMQPVCLRDRLLRSHGVIPFSDTNIQLAECVRGVRRGFRCLRRIETLLRLLLRLIRISQGRNRALDICNRLK